MQFSEKKKIHLKIVKFTNSIYKNGGLITKHRIFLSDLSYWPVPDITIAFYILAIKSCQLNFHFVSFIAVYV